MVTGILRRAFNNLSRLGPKRSLQTLASMAEDKWFDWRHGVDTTDRIPQSQLHVTNPERQAQASPYFMTRARAARFALSRSAVPKDCGLVDIGCGKGKVVMVAALEGFQSVTGIEFARELAEVAQSNLSKLRHRIPPTSSVQVVCADAATHEYDANDRVFYMYDPFGAEVMEVVCLRLRASLQRQPRQIWLIYGAPKHLAVVQRCLPVTRQSTVTYAGFDFAVLTVGPRTEAAEQVACNLNPPG